MDYSKVKNPGAKAFLSVYFPNRNLNLEFYKRVPEDKLDFRMTPKSDSPRESMAHQIDAERDYLGGVENGKLKFGVEYEDLKDLSKYSKADLLNMLEAEDKRLVDLLSDEKNCKRRVLAPWSSVPMSAIMMLYGMSSHEVLHTGWNLALMDLLGIERFPAMKQMWG